MKKRSRRRLQVDPTFKHGIASSAVLSATSRISTTQTTALRSRTSSPTHSDSRLLKPTSAAVHKNSLALVLPRPESPVGTVFDVEDEEMRSALVGIGDALQEVERAVSEARRRSSLEETGDGNARIERELLVLRNSNEGRAESRGKRRTFVKAFIAPSKDRENRQPTSLPRSKSIRSSNSPSTARMPPLHPRSCRQPSPSLPRH